MLSNPSLPPPRSWRASFCQLLTDRGEGDSPAGPGILLLLPKLIWPAEMGTNGKRHEKNVQHRLAWAHQGRWVDLTREALSPETARRLYRAAATGQLSKARKQLRAPRRKQSRTNARDKLRVHALPRPYCPMRSYTNRWSRMTDPGHHKCIG